MGNGLPKAILFDYEVPFLFGKGAFCAAFAHAAKKDESFAKVVRVIVFSGFYERCNEGNTPFDFLYETAVCSLSERKPYNEKLHEEFTRAWNRYLVINPKVKKHILAKAQVPIALLAITNPCHALIIEKLVSEKRYFEASYVYVAKPYERHDTRAAIQRLAKELAVPTNRLLYIGNVAEHEKIARDLHIEVINHKTPWDVSLLYKQLALFGLVK